MGYSSRISNKYIKDLVRAINDNSEKEKINLGLLMRVLACQCYIQTQGARRMQFQKKKWQKKCD